MERVIQLRHDLVVNKAYRKGVEAQLRHLKLTLKRKMREEESKWVGVYQIQINRLRMELDVLLAERLRTISEIKAVSPLKEGDMEEIVAEMEG